MSNTWRQENPKAFARGKRGSRAGDIRTDADCRLPCPNCGTTDGRDYSIFLDWLATQEDMERLLTWVRTHPCNHCAVKRQKQQEPRTRTCHEGSTPMSKEWWQENSAAFASGFTEERVIHQRVDASIPHTPISHQDDFSAALAGIRSRLDQLASINEANILVAGGPQERYHQLVEEAYAALGLVETQIDELRTELEYQHKRLDEARDIALAQQIEKQD